MLVGNNSTIKAFREEFYSHRLSHAFIIEGPRGSGRLTLARALSSILVCDKESAPCRECSACLRAESGTHPDIHEIVHRELTSQIKIDQIREFIEASHVKPSEADYNVFIIENAQMMNTASQNALLQIFEEPPENTLFFLLTTDRNLLLKTILSRARVLKTEKLSSEQIEKILFERFPDRKDEFPRALLIADGCAGEAIDFLMEENSSELLALAEEYLTKASCGASLFDLSKILSPFKSMTREELSALSSYLISGLRDALCIGAQYREKNIFFHHSSTPERLAEKFGQRRLLSAIEACRTVMRKSSSVSVVSALSHINTFFASDIK